ncbi:Sec-independent protein translocase protein TatB [Teichococcus oryzae]|uniref:Sec-independent protein translocase protein TatB n=1 Tax=Teichococcus oryzae TaxID=1608942 RepID=UPI001F4F377B|nr:Sec-independent protein translocase protein TatB [Pseudoroseomonas oryzae]
MALPAVPANGSGPRGGNGKHMFDLAWSELALIAVVAVVVIGPKDLPDAIRKMAKGIQKLRRMAAEFQTHADELVREAKLEDVRDQIRDIRNFDLKSTIERNLDSDGEIRRTFNDNPLRDDWKPDAGSGTTTPAAPPVSASAGSAPSESAPAVDAAPAAPAFVPPDIAAAAPGSAPHGHPPAPAEAAAAKPATPNA